MPTVEAKITSPRRLTEVYGYVADFTHLGEWDPGVRRVTVLTPGPVGAGTRCRVWVNANGLVFPMRYRCTRWQPSTGFAQWVGTSPTLRAVDDLWFTADSHGTHLHWKAALTLRGPLRPVSPLLKPVFDHAAGHTISALRDLLAQDQLLGSRGTK